MAPVDSRDDIGIWINPAWRRKIVGKEGKIIKYSHFTVFEICSCQNCFLRRSLLKLSADGEVKGESERFSDKECMSWLNKQNQSQPGSAKKKR